MSDDNPSITAAGSGKSEVEIAFELVSKLKGQGVWGERNQADILDMYAECLDAVRGLRPYKGQNRVDAPIHTAPQTQPQIQAQAQVQAQAPVPNSAPAQPQSQAQNPAQSQPQPTAAQIAQMHAQRQQAALMQQQQAQALQNPARAQPPNQAVSG